MQPLQDFWSTVFPRKPSFHGGKTSFNTCCKLSLRPVWSIGWTILSVVLFKDEQLF